MAQPHPQTRAYIALPCRPGDIVSAGQLVATHKTGAPECVFDFRQRSLSLLTTNFNWLWADALNERRRGCTHFVMMHDDVAPEAGWLRVLIDEQRRTRADILSCVIAIKDDRGLTSTAAYNWRTRKMRKFTVTETLKFPRSFDIEDAGYKAYPDGEHSLLLNTGLWICDITKPWAEKMVFRQHDAIVRQADGMFRPVSVSEDWLFSLDAARLGLRCVATTAVKINHKGSFEYPNWAPWGKLEREEDTDAAVAWDIRPPAAWGWPDEPVGVPQAVPHAAAPHAAQ